MLSIKEAARLCGTKAKDIRGYIREGRLRAEYVIGKDGPEWMVDGTALAEAGLLAETPNVMDTKDILILTQQEAQVKVLKLANEQLSQALEAVERRFDRHLDDLKGQYEARISELTTRNDLLVGEINAYRTEVAAVRGEGVKPKWRWPWAKW